MRYLIEQVRKARTGWRWHADRLLLGAGALADAASAAG